MTKGEEISAAIRPLISPGIKGTDKDVDEALSGVAKMIDNAFRESKKSKGEMLLSNRIIANNNDIETHRQKILNLQAENRALTFVLDNFNEIKS